jgi:DMSO/TMAO reductase YedYZ heme-binding membrane subunit
VATTRSRSVGRESARPSTGGTVSEHMSKVYGVAIAGIVVVVAFLALTSIGHVIDLATQHFMLYYAGVLALIALCASVGLGLVATDRMVLNPGHRVFVQSIHRAASFGALAFLIIHIVTEILAQRAHVIDAVVPFLSPFRTFYIGLGTIASDLIVLLVITSILRHRFTAENKAWRWRAIHYSAYLAFVFGIWHGLLGGRPGKPYVDWSYGFVIAFTALGLLVRVLANSLRPKENLSSPTVDERSAASAPIRALSVGMAAQMSSMRALAAGQQTSVARGALTATVIPAGTTGPMPALAALPPAGTGTGQQPLYEPGYEGPPRYMGAPRADSGPMPRAGTGAFPRADSGPMPRAGTGAFPRANSGPMPRAGTGPMPRAATGPMPRAGSGPMPRQAPPHPNSGPMPRAGTGPMPGPGTGPMPRPGTGPRPAPGSEGYGRRRQDTGPRPATGPMPAAGPRSAETDARQWPGSDPGTTPQPARHRRQATGGYRIPPYSTRGGDDRR